MALMAIPVANLQGKTAIITGGAIHLGRAIALAMAEAGAQVAFTYLESKDAAEQTLTEIKKMGRQAFAVQCDIRNGKSVADALEAIQARCGPVDLLVNNAGFFESAGFNDITEEQWDNMFSINVRGPFLVTKSCVPSLRSRHGRVINLGSLGGEKPWATHAHYCSSKAALHMLSRVMAKALAPEIAVNCVAPGMIDQGEDDSGVSHRFARNTPMKENGTPSDVVSAVMYFATAPHFITGQILTVDGGLGLK